MYYTYFDHLQSKQAKSLTVSFRGRKRDYRRRSKGAENDYGGVRIDIILEGVVERLVDGRLSTRDEDKYSHIVG